MYCKVICSQPERETNNHLVVEQQISAAAAVHQMAACDALGSPGKT